MQQVEVRPIPLDRLAAVIPPERAQRLRADVARAEAGFGDRTVWHVNATAHGGGVAEMLQTLLAYGIGAGSDNRWLVLDGDPAFFAVTKRLHNFLHGQPGDGGGLGPAEHRHYRETLARNAEQLGGLVAPGDLVLLHDPQTAGLAAGLQAAGAHVAWRCHIGRDTPNDLTQIGWEFLRGYLGEVEAFVFSLPEYAPDWVEPERLVVIPPSIDPFAAKNVELSPDTVRAVLAATGLVSGAEAPGEVQFLRRDGSHGVVRAHAERGGLLLSGQPPPLEARLVVQVSRWDRLKDMAGVMTGFALLAQDGLPEDVHLVLAGPEVAGVTDDPEGAEVLDECRDLLARQPDRARGRIHLVSVPMDDVDENAIIVNALQRHAYAVVQKSLVEGFGLTVTEAMWKSRPVLASRIGGIKSQITHERDGLLLDDPYDLDGFATLLGRLLADRALAERLGTAAHRTVVAEFLGDRHLDQYVDLFSRMAAGT